MIERAPLLPLVLGLLAVALALPEPGTGRDAAAAFGLAPVEELAASGHHGSHHHHHHVVASPSPEPVSLPELPDSWDVPDAPMTPNESVPAGGLLPAVDCIRYIIINGSDAEAAFKQQMQQLGLWDRITVQTELLDPNGKTAGAFLSHRRAWVAALEAGCRALLVLEEDTFFDVASMHPAAENANAFVDAHRDAYDMLFLGWGLSFLHTSHDGMVAVDRNMSVHHATLDGQPCIFGLHHWLLMHAYIISPAAMTQYAALQYNVSSTQVDGFQVPIDTLLELLWDRQRFFTVYPTFAFQGHHDLRSKAQGGVEKTKGATHDYLDALESIPVRRPPPQSGASGRVVSRTFRVLPPPKADEHDIENQVYNISHVTPPLDCLGHSLLASPEPVVGFPELPRHMQATGLTIPGGSARLDDNHPSASPAPRQ